MQWRGGTGRGKECDAGVWILTPWLGPFDHRGSPDRDVSFKSSRDMQAGKPTDWLRRAFKTYHRQGPLSHLCLLPRGRNQVRWCVKEPFKHKGAWLCCLVTNCRTADIFLSLSWCSLNVSYSNICNYYYSRRNSEMIYVYACPLFLTWEGQRLWASWPRGCFCS